MNTTIESGTQSIFETVKRSVEIDGYATLPLVQLKRQIDKSYDKSISLNELKKQLQDNPVEFNSYGTRYVATIAEDTQEGLSSGRVKGLERSKGKVIYARGSRVIESRRPNNNWRSNENAKIAELETTKMVIMPFELWQDIQKEKELQRITEEQNSKRERLSRRFITKSIQAKLLREAPSFNEPTELDWMSLARNKESFANIPSNAIFSIGFGIDRAVPLRLLSYPLLSLELLREKPGTSLEYYCATQFGDLFGLSYDEALIAQTITQQSIDSFIYQYFPDLLNRVHFLPSRAITADQDAFLRETLVPILTKKREFREFANARDGEGSLMYMAAHSLYMRDPLPIPGELFINPLPDTNNPVVMIGGDGESIMWQARQTIINALGGTIPLQLFTTLGRIPPYFRRELEPIVSEILTEEFLTQCTPELYRDYASLLVAIAKSYGAQDLQYADISSVVSRRSTFLSQESVVIALFLLNEFSLQIGTI